MTYYRVDTSLLEEEFLPLPGRHTSLEDATSARDRAASSYPDDDRRFRIVRVTEEVIQ